MEAWYVEMRRFHPLTTIAPRQVARLQQIPKLLPLTLDLKSLGQVHGSLLQSWGRYAGQPARNAKWTPAFSEQAAATIRAAPDPADGLSGSECLSRLAVSFNSAAVAEFDRVLRAAAGGNPPPWRLESHELSLRENSPLVHVVSVFAPTQTPDPARFEAESNQLNLLAEQFWSVHVTLLAQIRQLTPAATWTGLATPFGLPTSFHASGHPDFDPSEEYHFESHLFVRGTASELAPWQQQAVAARQETLARSSRCGATVRISWGTTVWELAHTTPAPSTPDLCDEVLRSSLASDMLKVATFRDRLYAALLHDVQSGRVKVPADEMRGLVYRDHALWQALGQRGRSLLEFDRDYYRIARQVYETDEHVESVRHLGDLVIHAAEGIEAEASLRAEQLLQRIALALSIVTLGALFLDGWNFLLGSPSEPISPQSLGVRSWYTSLLLICLTTLAILLSSLAIRRNRPRATS